MDKTKKTCEEVRNSLEKLLDGELSVQEHEVVKRELSDCPSCRQEFERLQKMRALVREVFLEDARNADLEELLPGVMAKIQAEPDSLLKRFSDWLDKYRLGLASPLAPVGVAATVAVAVIAGTLIYVSSGEATKDGNALQPDRTVAEKSVAPAADEGAPSALASKAPGEVLADDGEHGLTGRRPRHDEKPFKKNECFVTYYNVESGTVVIDVDPEGDEPAVVWHFSDDLESPAVEDNRI